MMTSLSVLNAGLDIFAAVILAAVFFSCSSEMHDRSRSDRYISYLVVLVIVMLVTRTVCYFIEGNSDNIIFQYILRIISYIATQLAALTFTMYIKSHLSGVVEMPKWVPQIAVAFTVLNVLLFVSSAFSGMYFYIDGNGYWQNGRLYWLCIILSFIIILSDCIFVLINCRRTGIRNAILILLYAVFPILAGGFVRIWDSTVIYLAVTMSTILIYIMEHQNRSIRSAEQGRELMRQRAELANSRTKIMISQMQPHFLYNSLNAIYYLIEKDPATAQKALNDFSEYLRMNLDTLSSAEPVEFDKELKHIETYLWIEKLRFDEDLNIEYDIRERDFRVPALSIQPFVENAVKHGLCKKPEGGTLKFTTGGDEEKVVISISDDGVGFDVNAPHIDDGRTHIGMDNSRQRLETVLGAKVDIKSVIGRGTVVTIVIPRKGDEQEPGKVILCE